MTATRDRLLSVARLYASAKGLSMARVSTLAANDGKLLGRIASGRDLTTGTFDQMVGWFSSNWPEDVPWPADVARPASSGDAP